MVILGVETSCDETALALIEAEDDSVRVLADITHSQAALHAKYGGVFPNLAKREHSRNLIPLLKNLLAESGFGNPKSQAPRLPIGGQANSLPAPNRLRQAGKQFQNSNFQISKLSF